MPEVLRQSTRLDCLGLDLVHPLDRMPPGYFPYLSNVRVLQEGRVDARPGYTPYSNLLSPHLHSIRRLNDPDESNSSAGYVYLVGDGTALLGGQETGLASIDTGYSGDPLSLLLERPDQSSESHWLYVYDANKQIKVNPSLATKPVGTAPPTGEILATYGAPAVAVINEGQSNTGWTAVGPISTIDLVNREGAAVTSTVNTILYDSGTTGWCCFRPISASNFTWGGNRMRVILDAGGPNAETIVIREIHPAITTTTIESIQYDSGTTGLCTAVFVGSPEGLARNSLIVIGTDDIRVLEVIPSPDGVSYAVRFYAAQNHVAGATVTGHLSWYAYTTLTHVGGETITSQCVYARAAAFTTKTATASISLLGNIDASKASGRSISLSDDYMHISFWATNAPGITSVKLLLDVDDGTTSLSNAFKNNYYVFTLTPQQIYGAVIPSAGYWFEILVPLSEGVRAGNNPANSLANIKAIRIELALTQATDFAFDWWYLFGTYGPFVAPNSPVGLLYASANRDSTTGSASVPGPQMRYELFPLREEVIVTPKATAAADVDSLDVYRQGNTLLDFTYIGTAVNNAVTPNSYADTLPDTAVQANPVADRALIQPWPILDLEWSGVVNVVGTRVTRISGTPFDLDLLSATEITINGISYQTYGQPISASILEITASAGTQNNVSYKIASPTIAAQSLPFAFGPLEGPYLPVVFALGDLRNSGTLYYSNAGNLDAASDQNTLEICPAESLISGAVWNGLVIVGSKDNLFLVRYSYQGNLGVPGPVTYQFSRLPSLSGMWARWACCQGPDGVYFLGRDGIYKATEAGADIACRLPDGTDPLYPLFPHDGQAGAGANGLSAIDMSAFTSLRLSCCDQDIYFDYKDVDGNSRTLRLDIPKKRWFPHIYGDPAVLHYLVEGSLDAPTSPQILLLSRDSGRIYLSGGNDDAGLDINSVAQLPSSDGGDERVQKLYVDAMTQADGTGDLAAQIQFNTQEVSGPSLALACTGPITQFLENISSLADLSLYRNISVRYTWTGGPAGPRIYAWEPSGYAQPYLSTFLVTQFITLSFTDWKHARRLYPALISNAEVKLTIKTQNGRSFITAIPSTGGQFKVQPLMSRHGCKDLSFAFELDGNGTPFALFPDDFTIEFKGWNGPEYIDLSVWKT